MFLAQRAELLVSLFERAGVGGAETIDDLIAERWAKLSVNCYVNALGGLSGLGSSTMRRSVTCWLHAKLVLLSSIGDNLLVWA